ncbi:acyltransferase [Methylosinus sp. Sm6]|uniref:acyltransferase family protein n=1 Tax=Methylosinus sp. Sm6 TaxID=2866948 RepID=UPI001C998F73|nr:acyltransferase [Methylosinus sp. Sm6]MBY6241150.1 acyltransferase [Methylosinus sp. Sm6]
MQSTKSVRYLVLDSYRFLAASGVVLFHYDIDFQLGLATRFPVVANLSCMVDFFFILSGFVIVQGYRSRLGSAREYGEFLRARWARIYPLHVLTLACYLLLVAIAHVLRFQPNHPEILALSGLPANLLLVQAWGLLDHPSFNVPSWSISAEWFVYLLAPAVFAIVRHVSLAFSLLCALLMATVMIAAQNALGVQDWMELTYRFGMLRALPSFFAGAAIAEAMCNGQLRGKPSWWTVHALAASALVVLSLDVRRELLLPVFCSLIALAALADAGGAPTLMKSRVLLALGASSYALYMSHVLVSVPLLIVARRLHLIETPWTFAFAFASFGITIVLSLLSYRYFERPMRSWMMRVGKSTSPSPRRDSGSAAISSSETVRF